MTRVEYLTEIARRAGVSVGSVYRYMSEHSDRHVSEDTRVRIADAVASMDCEVPSPHGDGPMGARYMVTMLDVTTDLVFVETKTNSYRGIKQIIRHELRGLGLTKYDPLGDYPVYIYDSQFDESRLAQLTYKQPSDITAERGLDFDVWHDEYLSESERKQYDKA